MFLERRINTSSNKVELWSCRWEYPEESSARKNYIEKICEEQEVRYESDGDASNKIAICWAHGRTLGNIAVQSPIVLGYFKEKSGKDAVLPCDFASAGKFRHGAERLWCRTHQTHWGIKADLESYEQTKQMRCSNYSQRMNYVVDPLTVNLDAYAEVGIWCSMPAALSSEEILSAPPAIHVHTRENVGGEKGTDEDFSAISLTYSSDIDMFGNQEITRVNISPPAAFEFVRATESGQELDCINCSACGYPHLDLADFAKKPHRKHFCGNCGRDSTWSKKAIVSTPLKALHDRFANDVTTIVPEKTLVLDEFRGLSYKVWASTPAIVWTANRPQEVGIHVHVDDGSKRVVDDTYGEVVHRGAPLERTKLIKKMFARSKV